MRITIGGVMKFYFGLKLLVILPPSNAPAVGLVYRLNVRARLNVRPVLNPKSKFLNNANCQSLNKVSSLVFFFKLSVCW